MYSIYAVYGCSQRQVKADGKAAAQVAVAKYSADAKCTKIVVQKGWLGEFLVPHLLF